MSEPIHVTPINDLIDHEDSDGCVCGPEVRPVPREDGSMAWMAEAEERAARVGLVPAVCYRRNAEPWRVALPLTDFLDLLSVRQLPIGETE